MNSDLMKVFWHICKQAWPLILLLALLGAMVGWGVTVYIRLLME